jgi:hypothetical protein
MKQIHAHKNIRRHITEQYLHCLLRVLLLFMFINTQNNLSTIDVSEEEYMDDY